MHRILDLLRIEPEHARVGRYDIRPERRDLLGSCLAEVPCSLAEAADSVSLFNGQSA
jgi:hypothetical protein